MGNKEKIEKLKKELERVSEKDDKRLEAIEEQNQIKDLKKQIRKKKYAGVMQVGKNLKKTGKGIGKGFKALDKGFGKLFMVNGEDPKKPRKTVEEVLKNLPQ